MEHEYKVYKISLNGEQIDTNRTIKLNSSLQKQDVMAKIFSLYGFAQYAHSFVVNYKENNSVIEVAYGDFRGTKSTELNQVHWLLRKI